MNIFIFHKKSIIIFLIIIILFSFVIFHKVFCSSTLTCNSEISENFLNNINTIYDSNEKLAYLTFDDGPTPSVTPIILDILKEENIRATFFVIGKKVSEHPEIVKRAYEEGHYIANHTYNHNNSILYRNLDSFLKEIKETDLAIGNAIGISNYSSHVFRFPNGFMSNIYKSEKEKFIKYFSEIEYTYIDWNCLNKDSETKYTNEQLLNNLKSTSKNKNVLVVLMHDTKDVNDSSKILKQSINYLKSQGYKFKNLYDL